MLKFTPEDQNQDKWNEFVSDYILKCNNPNSVSKNLNWLSNIRDPAMTSQQINRIKKLLGQSEQLINFGVSKQLFFCKIYSFNFYQKMTIYDNDNFLGEFLFENSY